MIARAAVSAAAALSIACSTAPPPQPKSTTAADPPRITQLYATAPKYTPGEQEMICYGVENAKKVWLEPPRQELSAALSRCVEVKPEGNTTYTLTAEDGAGHA